jgi:thiosulfate dehydrogenase (quinone) large subunit
MKFTQFFPSFSISDRTTQHIAVVGPTIPTSFSPSSFHSWMLIPQRLFLALTFLYAGVQKLTDPQFFHKATPGYIGNQIISFAHGSPLHYWLIKLVLPHAVLFGWTVALGEIAIGIGVLFGLLFRPAAFFGMLLSILFFLTASWNVYPYFYGADIVFAFCWFTLFLTGPLPTSLPSIDGWLQKAFFPQGFSSKQNWLVRLLGVLLLGMNTFRATDAGMQGNQQHQRSSLTQRQRQNRRSFLSGALAGGATMVGVAVMSVVLHVFNRPGASSSAATSAASSQNTGATGSIIAQIQAVPENSAATFTIASTGDPGVLIHLANNQFVAYDATCTHAGCQVGYDQASQHLICPCHGATFDPAQQAAVLQGPAGTPLTSVPIHIDSATGNITES